MPGSARCWQFFLLLLLLDGVLAAAITRNNQDNQKKVNNKLTFLSCTRIQTTMRSRYGSYSCQVVGVQTNNVKPFDQKIWIAVYDKGLQVMNNKRTNDPPMKQNTGEGCDVLGFESQFDRDTDVAQERSIDVGDLSVQDIIGYDKAGRSDHPTPSMEGPRQLSGAWIRLTYSGRPVYSFGNSKARCLLTTPSILSLVINNSLTKVH